jgi:hypothetical protein
MMSCKIFSKTTIERDFKSKTIILFLTLSIILNMKNVFSISRDIGKFIGKNKIYLKEIKQIHLHMKDVKITGIQVDANGNIYLADGAQKKIHVFDKKGKFKIFIGESQNENKGINSCISIRQYNNFIGVLDTMSSKILFFETTGIYNKKIDLAADNFFCGMPGYFDFIKNGDQNKLCVGIARNIKPIEKLVKNSNTVCLYNKKLKPVTLFGKYDEHIFEYYKRTSLWTIPRTDMDGNIYTIQISVPNITKYNDRGTELAKYNFNSEEFKFPYSNSTKLKFDSPNVSTVIDFNICQKTGRIFILHGYYKYNAGTNKKKNYHFLTILDQSGKILITDFPVGNTPCFCLDGNENIYYLQSTTFNKVILGKSKLIE